MKRYIVRLDDSPQDRWTHVIRDFVEPIKQVISLVDSHISYLSQGTITKLTTQGLISLVKKAYQSGWVYYGDEIGAIAKQLGVEVWKVTIMQLCYEAFAACTTAQLPVDGKYVQFRTMDWAMPELKQLTINVTFTYQGKMVFKAVTWAGCVGVFTGLSCNHWSVALNYRRKSFNVLTNIKKALIDYSWPASFLIRSTLEDKVSSSRAVAYFKNSKLISPCYISICTPIKGYVLERDRDRCELVRECSKGNILVQANRDYNSVSRSDNILWSKERCEMVKKLSSTHKFMDCKDVLKTLPQHPVKNHETIYVCVMDPLMHKIHM